MPPPPPHWVTACRRPSRPVAVRCSAGAAFNFSPASKRDAVLYGCHMPGFTGGPDPEAGGITEATMKAGRGGAPLLL